MMCQGQQVREQVELAATREGQRLDRFVAERLAAHSRSEIQHWIQAGDVKVNGRTAKPSQRLQEGDVVHVLLPDVTVQEIRPSDTALCIVYEDADCAVVDKPPGMVVHPATSHRQETLANALLARYPEMKEMADPASRAVRRPGIVHRLDKDTSGLMVVARHTAAQAALQAQFKQRSVGKGYLALLYGRLALSEGVIDAPIGRDPRQRKRMAVVANGRSASTRYTVRQFLYTPHGTPEYYTLVEARPATGRTHQIRVHFAHIGYPIVGDTVYGRHKSHLSCPRQFLHAYRLGFRRPSDGEWMVFESPLPADLQKVLSQLQVVT
jgi:23S rRNA pseudouridine1911/1915/1917 synthase